jgi:hypothetical protein
VRHCYRSESYFLHPYLIILPVTSLVKVPPGTAFVQRDMKKQVEDVWMEDMWTPVYRLHPEHKTQDRLLTSRIGVSTNRLKQVCWIRWWAVTGRHRGGRRNNADRAGSGSRSIQILGRCAAGRFFQADRGGDPKAMGAAP